MLDRMQLAEGSLMEPVLGRIVLTEEEFAETVIEAAYIRTVRSDLRWSVSDRTVKADLDKRISVSIFYKENGPGSAVWDFVNISHPTGSDSVLNSTNVQNPTLGKHSEASAQILERIGKIFDHVVLISRKRELEAAMEELRRSAGLSR